VDVAEQEPRGDLFHQSAEAENCYGPFADAQFRDPEPAFGWAGSDADTEEELALADEVEAAGDLGLHQVESDVDVAEPSSRAASISTSSIRAPRRRTATAPSPTRSSATRSPPSAGA
jgi:hypothetical protein